MPFLNFPDDTVVVVPHLLRAWVSIVRDIDGAGWLVPATNAEELQEEAAAFLRSFGPTDLDGGAIYVDGGGAIRVCPPALAAKAIFPGADWRPYLPD